MESIVIDHKLHIIGGFDSNHHHIWNETRNKLESIHQIDEFQGGVFHHVLLHIPSRNELLIMGGYCPREDDRTASTYSYLFDENKCVKLDEELNLPTENCAFGIVLSPDEKYAILLGGDSNDLKYNGIHLLDLEHHIFYTLINLKCPVINESYAMIIDNSSSNDIVSFGFILKLDIINE